MDSFNVYRQTTETIGGNTPIWLGTVKPIPRGATIEGVGRFSGTVLPAGTPVSFDPTTLTVGIRNSVSDAISNANGYLYNDICFKNAQAGNIAATCAVVMHHPEGLLIERVFPEITEEEIAALQAKIPGVLLVRG
jgi:hypothetical protein